jgi:hypothetical protein
MWEPPDIEKLAREARANLLDPAALRALGASIVARYGQTVLHEVDSRVGKMLIFNDQTMLRKNLGELWRDACTMRKRTK